MSSNEFEDYYELLEVPKDASFEELKRSYRNLSKIHHPDMNEHLPEQERNQKAEQFKKISEGYQILNNWKTRREYDYYYEQQKQQFSSQKEQESTLRWEPQTSKAKKQKEKAQEETPRTSWQQWKQQWDIHYQAVKKEERRYSLRKRHEKKDDYIYESYYDGEDTLLKNMTFQLQRGSIHLCYETLYQLHKLSYLNKEPFLKFIIRNRKGITTSAMLATAVLLTSFGTQDAKGQETELEPQIQTDQATTSFETKTEEQEEEIILNRIYDVKAGDTLHQLSLESNTTQKYIMQVNYMENTVLQAGTTLKLPYFVSSKNLMYYTKQEFWNQDETLSSYAKRNHTDIATLLKLNKEAIIEQEDTYTVLSDTLMIPNFISYRELQTKTESKQKTIS